MTRLQVGFGIGIGMNTDTSNPTRVGHELKEREGKEEKDPPGGKSGVYLFFPSSFFLSNDRDWGVHRFRFRRGITPTAREGLARKTKPERKSVR